MAEKKLINEQYDVQEADASKGFAKGERRSDYADPWKETGNIVLMGLDGCGKGELASLLAERTRQEAATPKSPEEAVESLSGKGRIVVLRDDLVDHADVRPLIHGSGKAFYLQADTNTLSARVAERDGVDDKEALWRESSARLAQLEPVFYETLHFILHAFNGPEAMVEDALEKIAL